MHWFHFLCIYISRSGITWSYSSYILFEELPYFFYNYSNYFSQQQCIRVSFSPLPHQHLLSFLFLPHHPKFLAVFGLECRTLCLLGKYIPDLFCFGYLGDSVLHLCPASLDYVVAIYAFCVAEMTDAHHHDWLFLDWDGFSWPFFPPGCPGNMILLIFVCLWNSWNYRPELPHLASFLFDNNHSNGCEVIFHCDFYFAFPWLVMVNIFYVYLLMIWMSSLENIYSVPLSI
jgi:hypothetical protein